MTVPTFFAPIWRHRIAALTLAVAPLTCIAAAPALAHSFETVVIAPDGAPSTQAEITQAFLIASSETDGHANEDSNGHLGGLDVYLTVISLNEIAAIRDISAHFIATPIALAGGSSLNQTITDSGAVLVPPLSPSSLEGAQYLATPSDPALPPFADRFMARTGRQPGELAAATYIAARRIDSAMRATGDASNIEQLNGLIAR